MAKKKKHEEHENHERWLVSYADFITLLFAFFVVMYSVSRTDTQRLIQASNSIRWALHFEGTGGVGHPPVFNGPPSEGGCVTNQGNNPVRSASGKRIIEQLRRRVEQRLKPYLIERNMAGSIVVQADNNKLLLRMSAGPFFDPSSAALRPEVLVVMDAIGEELKDLNRAVRVEGHTDSAPTRIGRFRNNWDLSAARAVTVVTYLQDAHGIAPEKLTAVGLAATRPLVPSDTPEHQEQNRRVELVMELNPDDALNIAVR